MDSGYLRTDPRYIGTAGYLEIDSGYLEMDSGYLEIDSG